MTSGGNATGIIAPGHRELHPQQPQLLGTFHSRACVPANDLGKFPHGVSRQPGRSSGLDGQQDGCGCPGDSSHRGWCRAPTLPLCALPAAFFGGTHSTQLTTQGLCLTPWLRVAAGDSPGYKDFTAGSSYFGFRARGCCSSLCPGHTCLGGTEPSGWVQHHPGQPCTGLPHPWNVALP